MLQMAAAMVLPLIVEAMSTAPDSLAVAWVKQMVVVMIRW